jgi:hypothetical protein
MSLLNILKTQDIILQKKQAVEVYQVAMDLLVQNTQHPFIAILILAGELAAKGHYYITPLHLKQYLFDSLPERACLNLLNRIEKENYLIQNHSIKDAFELTNSGKACIASKSIWVGEKGIYNLYITESPFVTQRIVAVTRVNSRDVQNDRKTQVTFSNALQYLESKNIQIKSVDNDSNTYKNETYYIKSIGQNYFKLPDESWNLKYVAKPNAAVELQLTFANNKYERSLPKTDTNLLDELLTHQFNVDYDAPCILTTFDELRLEFARTVQITDFKISGALFEPIRLQNIPHRPKTFAEAQKWYFQILKNSISKYYTDEMFKIESERCKELFKPYFNLPLLLRQDLIKTLSNPKNDFYLKAKLETIDFLNY